MEARSSSVRLTEPVELHAIATWCTGMETTCKCGCV